jgi:hypothetical protein
MLRQREGPGVAATLIAAAKLQCRAIGCSTVSLTTTHEAKSGTVRAFMAGSGLFLLAAGVELTEMAAYGASRPLPGVPAKVP